MNGLKYFILIFFFSYGCSKTLFSQQPQTDTVFYRQSVDSVAALYTKEAGSNLSLYNGSEYIRSAVSTKGFPFFLSENLIEGLVFYDGNLYQHVNMQYDIARDELVINNFLQNATVKLISTKVGYFTLGQHQFIYFLPDNKTASFMPPGYYEKLFSGKIAVLAKRAKKNKVSLNAEDNSSDYIVRDKYFLQIEGIYYEVTDRQSLFKLLADEKSQLKKYMRENAINFKKGFENAILKIITYYLQIKN